jgi:hemerythrin-like domain-containing protein/Flp pilus assembly pilin Flp
MYAALPRLKQDHKNVASVLAVIEEQGKAVANGGEHDPVLMEAAIRYFGQYFTQFHQVKEDLIFGHLLGRVGDFPRKIFPLVEDHRQLLKWIDALDRALKNLENGGSTSRKRFSQTVAGFVERQRAHLTAEEEFFYPEAERWLNEQQWREVESMPNAIDPLAPEQRPRPGGAQEGAREAVGIFLTSADLQRAIDTLLSSGFNRADLSLLANAGTVDDKLGYRYKKIEDLEDDPSVPRTAYVSPEAIGDAEGGLIGALFYIGAITATGAVVASGGTLATLIAVAVVAGGAGGLVGSILAKWLGSHHGHYLQEQLDRGGLLLWVRTPNRAAEQRAVQILREHSGEDVHVHAIPTPSL